MSKGLAWEEFQRMALRTESKVAEANVDLDGLTALLRLFIHIGKFLDYNKKGIFYNNYSKYDNNNIAMLDHLNDLCFNFMSTESAANRKPVNNLDFRIVHGLLGPLTESTELAEHLLNYLETGEIDRVGVAEEFSDSDWYKGIAYDALDIDNGVAWNNVIEKLRIRFPDKYSDEAAENRRLDEERQKLEASMGQ